MSRKKKKIAAYFLAIVIMITMVNFFPEAVPEIKAAEETITGETTTEETKQEEQPAEQVEQEQAYTLSNAVVTVTDFQSVNYSSSYGHIFTINGTTSAYCCNKNNSNTPTAGVTSEIVDITSDAYKQVFYYGCLHVRIDFSCF